MEAPSGSKALRETGPRGFPTRRQLFGLLLGYFAVHVLVRAFLSSSVDLDESEQIVLTQKLSWGYSSAPPLYPWLQAAVFAVFGPSVLGLALLKNLLLLSLYLLTYANARLITRSHLCGAAAALSLLYLPAVAWECQRDLTHTILASAIVAATLLAFLRVHETRRLSWYAALGICAGLGLLSKFNYCFWLLGFLLAAVLTRPFRSTVLDRRLLLAAAVCALLFLPTGVWMLQHRELALLTSSKLAIRSSAGWLPAVATGLRNLLQAFFSFVGPLSLVYLVVFWKAPRQGTVPRLGTDYAQLLSRALLCSLGVLLLGICCFKATQVRERWLQPVLLSVPVLAVAWLQDRLDPARLKRLAALSLGVMLIVAIAIPGRIVLGERLRREEPLMRPHDALATQIRALLPDASFIVADSMVLAGNLRLALPDKPVAAPAFFRLLQVPHQHCVFVWDARNQALPLPPLRGWAKTLAPVNWTNARPQYFSATYKFHRSRQMRLGMLQLY